MFASSKVTTAQGERQRHLWILLSGAFLLAGYGAFLLHNSAFAVGGSDSSGYLNTARRMREGTLVARPRSLDRLGLPDQQAQTCIPLGFMTGPRPGTMAPFYPAGFPAHLLAAATIAGWDTGPYLVSPLAALLCVLLCYRLGRELGLSAAAAAAAGAVLAAWPVFLFQALQPMSDVVATAWCLAAVLFARLARGRPPWAAASGAALGIAVLVRPTDALLLIPLLFALPLSPRPLLRFAAGGIPAAILLAAYNRHCYGSPLRSGYGATGHLEAFALSHFWPRITYYGAHLLETFAFVVPIAWLALLWRRSGTSRDRALLLSWFGAFLIFFCFYGPYESFIFVRFLLPGIPALILGAALVIERWRDSPGVIRFAPLAILLVVLAVEVRSTHRLGVLGVIEDQSAYREACRWAEAQLPGHSVLIAAESSGALEYYTNVTYIRYEWLDPESFRRIQASERLRGYGWFALLFTNEPEEFRKHIPGRWAPAGEKRDVSLWKYEEP
jgi:hypothetical protein